MGKAKGKRIYASESARFRSERHGCTHESNGVGAMANKNRLLISNPLLLKLFVFRMDSVGEQGSRVQ
jgi:hypothetical protein